MRKRGAAAAIALAAVLGSAQAQYPVKPVRLIVPFPPGGGTDTIARILAPRLAEAFGQSVVIDNRPGAGANIGAEIAAKSPPDGYTVLLAAISHSIGPSLYAKLGYDIVRDLAPVMRLATAPHLLVLHPSVPAKTLKELITLARARPGALTYSSSGNGTPTHLAAALFATMTGTKMVHVPYKGGGPSVAALVSGEVSLSVATMPSAVGHVRAGRLRALAATGAQRSRALPELPTVAEAGLPGYTMDAWYGLMVPAGSPQSAIARLHAETAKLLAAPEVQERLGAAGYEPFPSTPEEFGAFIRSEIEKWAKVVKAAGLRVD